MPAPFKSLSHYGNAFNKGGRLSNEIYIDSTDGTAAAALYAALLARRAELEAVYGSPLEFQELPGKRACRIVEYGDGKVQETERHDEFIDWLFDRGERLRKAINAVAEEDSSRDQQLADLLGRGRWFLRATGDSCLNRCCEELPARKEVSSSSAPSSWVGIDGVGLFTE